MNESLRLAAWLDAHAKYMKYREEQTEMHKAARALRILEQERLDNVTVLHDAQKMLSEMRKMLEEAYGQLPQQEASRGCAQLPVSALRG